MKKIIRHKYDNSNTDKVMYKIGFTVGLVWITASLDYRHGIKV